MELKKNSSFVIKNKFNNNLVYLFFIRKLIKSGKVKTSINIIRNFIKLERNERVFLKAVISLFVPLSFKSEKKIVSTYEDSYLIHYYKPILLAITWIINSAKKRKFPKMSFYKSLYIECCDVLKKKGGAYENMERFMEKICV